MYYDMRTCLSLLLSFFCCFFATAQNKYEVTSNSRLNIRSAAGTSAPVVGSVSHGDIIDVYEISNGWAKIRVNNGYAYVSAQYIEARPDLNPKTEVKESNHSGCFENLHFNFSFGIGETQAQDLAYVIAILSLLLYIIRRLREDEPIKGSALYVSNLILFLLAVIIEIVYIVEMQDSTLWFCDPYDVGWLWAIIDFLIFGGIVYNQVLSLLNTIQDIVYHSGGDYFDIRWGAYSIVGGVIGGVVTGICWPEGGIIVGGAFLVCQIVQIVLMFRGIVPDGGWLNAILCLLVYVLGVIATVGILIYFLLLLILVLIVLVVLFVLGFGSGGRSSSSGSSSGSSGSSSCTPRCCENCSHFYSGANRCDYHNRTISDPNAYECQDFY
jgi:hypothetical protein